MAHKELLYGSHSDPYPAQHIEAIDDTAANSLLDRAEELESSAQEATAARIAKLPGWAQFFEQDPETAARLSAEAIQELQSGELKF